VSYLCFFDDEKNISLVISSESKLFTLTSIEPCGNIMFIDSETFAPIIPRKVVFSVPEKGFKLNCTFYENRIIVDFPANNNSPLDILLIPNNLYFIKTDTEMKVFEIQSQETLLAQKKFFEARKNTVLIPDTLTLFNISSP
jgi:hypothetical protein